MPVAIEENVRRILDEAAEAAVASGRSPEEVTVLAATKMNEKEAIARAIAAGISVVGENRVQELTAKLGENAYEGAKEVHFIGALQKNKVRQLVGNVALIQSVPDWETAAEISRRAEAKSLVQPILLEVNIGREAQKSGLLPEALDETAARCALLPGITLSGIMTIPPRAENSADSVEFFEEMYKLFIDLRSKKYDNSNVRILSMGMSADFAAAIRAGANLVRIGSAIFGPRAYPVKVPDAQ